MKIIGQMMILLSMLIFSITFYFVYTLIPNSTVIEPPTTQYIDLSAGIPYVLGSYFENIVIHGLGIPRYTGIYAYEGNNSITYDLIEPKLREICPYKCENKSLFIGQGVTQCYLSLIYALSEKYNKLLVVQKIPDYNMHRPLTLMVPNTRYQAFNLSDEITINPGEILIEIITSPNNPDCLIRRNYTNAKVLILDLSYLSESFVPSNIMGDELNWINSINSTNEVYEIFSLSKHIGSAGFRIGYTFISNPDILNSCIYYRDLVTIGVSTMSLMLMNQTLESMILNPNKLSKYHSDINNLLSSRATEIFNGLKQYYPDLINLNNTELTMPYLWIKSDSIQDLYIELLTILSIKTVNGNAYNDTNNKVRISLMTTEKVYKNLIKLLNVHSGIYKN